LAEVIDMLRGLPDAQVGEDWQEIANVAGDQTTDKAFWNSICGDWGYLLSVEDIILVQMGDVKDYFKPRFTMSLCHFLFFHKYTWSNTEDGNYIVPSYNGNIHANYGGSAAHFPTDGRLYLPFWGVELPNYGGCCHDTSSIYGDGADKNSWHRSFSMSIKRKDSRIQHLQQHLQQDQGGIWIECGFHESCSKKCNERSLTCNADKVNALNTFDAVAAVYWELGSACVSTFNTGYPAESERAWRKESSPGICTYLGSAGGFTCDYMYKHADWKFLCWCE